MEEYIPVKFERHIKNTIRPRSNRRIAAAKRNILKKATNYPLFEKQFKQEMGVETDDDLHHASMNYLDKAELESYKFWQMMRDSDAERWRRCRKRLRELPREQRNEFVLAWNQLKAPKKAVYFADHIHCTIGFCEKPGQGGHPSRGTATSAENTE